MSQEIRVTDLRRPVLNRTQAEALRSAAATPFELSLDAVLTTAAELARLDDFGPTDFHERVELILASAAWSGHTPFAQLSTLNALIDKAVVRLLTVNLLKRHPEIRAERIEAPLVVMGLPRSGTTHLLNLLAADSRLHSMPYWEVRRPVALLPEDAVVAGQPDPRWLRAQRHWEFLQEMDPYATAYHPMTPDHISEDGELQMADFASYVWEFNLRAPQWRDYYLAHDQTPHYEYQKLMMQVLQWQRGVAKRWVFKSPQHLEQLGPILRVFPDAQILVTQRDPVASLQSIVQRNTYTARWREKVVTPDFYLDYWTQRFHALLEAYLNDVGLVPPGQLSDVVFHEFVRDDIGTVEAIYRSVGIEMTDTARRELEAYNAEHRRGANGRIVFDLQRDFGVEPAQVRNTYAAYLDAVDVPVEVR